MCSDLCPLDSSQTIGPLNLLGSHGIFRNYLHTKFHIFEISNTICYSRTLLFSLIMQDTIGTKKSTTVHKHYIRTQCLSFSITSHHNKFQYTVSGKTLCNYNNVQSCIKYYESISALITHHTK